MPKILLIDAEKWELLIRARDVMERVIRDIQSQIYERERSENWDVRTLTPDKICELFGSPEKAHFHVESRSTDPAAVHAAVVRALPHAVSASRKAAMKHGYSAIDSTNSAVARSVKATGTISPRQKKR